MFQEFHEQESSHRTFPFFNSKYTFDINKTFFLQILNAATSVRHQMLDLMTDYPPETLVAMEINQMTPSLHKMGVASRHL